MRKLLLATMVLLLAAPAYGAGKPCDELKSEIDAKLFAMQILAKGWSASAGTLNPYQPKQVIATSQVEHWVDLAARRHRA